jgi:hypothetical protein
LRLERVDFQVEVQMHKTVLLIGERCDAIGQCIIRLHCQVLI